METQTMPSFPEEALQHVLSFISSHADRNSISLVCKSWYDIERWCRRLVFIGNCYAVSPPILVRRFTDVRSVTIKGKHKAADYDCVPEGWGAHALPWIEALVEVYPVMEEIRMKRMVITYEGLELIGRKLKNLRVLVLHKCEGISTHGLAFIAANCRILDLCESEIEDLGGNWISLFPNSYTSLEVLNLQHLASELPFSTLECLVDRSSNLKSLHVNQSYPLEKLVDLLLKAPQLADLGIGLFTMEPCLEVFTKLTRAFSGCKGLKSLSGICDVNPYYLPAIYPICPGLTSLNLRYATLRCPDLVKLLRHCPNLQRLLVLDYIEDHGLEVLAESCKEMQELRVVFSDPYDTDPSINLTERGLVSVAVGCPKLHSIVYYCNQMSNAALLAVAKNMPNLIRLRICIHEPQLPDYLTLECCKNLKRLWVTGLYTDRLLQHIGAHGKKLEILTLTFGRNSDLGLHYVLSGCSNLRQLIIRGCPFDGQALLANSDRLERMQSLWMLSCPVSYQACKLLGKMHLRLNVEVINEKWPSQLHSMSKECHVENLHVYRTVAGPRLAMPAFVHNAN